MKIEVVDISAEIVAMATLSTRDTAISAVQVAILALVMRRRELFDVDPVAARDFDLALIRILFGSGARA
jgi:hypothetical protein